MTVDDLVNELAKPTMVYRFAKADYRKNSGAETRMNNANIEIQNIVLKYAHHWWYTATDESREV